MHYRKNQCLQCGRPESGRPCTLKSEWNWDFDSDPYLGTLDERGTFSNTHFWFCSDKCYEAALSQYLDKDYAFEYTIGSVDTKTLAPKLLKDIDALSDKYDKMFPVPIHELPDEMFKHICQLREAEWVALKKKWQIQQGFAMKKARHDLYKRIDDEYWQQYFREQEKELEEKDKIDAATDKEIERLSEEGDRMKEKEQREAERREEKRQREEERARREQERLDEKRAREEEKRKKEEAERAAKEAEEKKWRPRWFKL